MMTAERSFAAWLRSEMKAQGMGVRELGRRIDPDDPERGRRNIHRWLNGTKPNSWMRERVSRALDVSEDQMPGGR